MAADVVFQTALNATTTHLFPRESKTIFIPEGKRNLFGLVYKSSGTTDVVVG
jgi:hypothetical protein